MVDFEQPGQMRATLTEEGSALRIRIPMRRSILLAAFMTCWLSFWSYAGWQTGKHLLQEFQFFELAWMGMWAVGEIFVIYFLFRSATGEDLLLVSSDRLTLKKTILGIGSDKNYRPSEVRNLRFQAQTGGGKSHRPSRIAFDHGAKTVEFGEGLDEAEANQLIAIIKSRCCISDGLPSTQAGSTIWQQA
jgi:hypothetical protein